MNNDEKALTGLPQQFRYLEKGEERQLEKVLSAGINISDVPRTYYLLLLPAIHLEAVEQLKTKHIDVNEIVGYRPVIKENYFGADYFVRSELRERKNIILLPTQPQNPRSREYAYA